jgi:cellulose synthase/poly-beta-1,6-N-acetylglucosamine synthase-like glycosyltransferase
MRSDGSTGRGDGRRPRALPGAPTRQDAILAPDLLPQQPPDLNQYQFLVGSVIDAGTLARAAAEAARCGVATHEVLLARGLPPTVYAAALAQSLGVPLVGWEATLHVDTAEEAAGADVIGVPAAVAGRSYRILCAEYRTPDILRRQIDALHAHGVEVAVAIGARVDAAIEDYRRAQRIDLAVRGLFRRRRVDSAGGVMLWTRQVVAAAVAVGLAAGGLAVAPEATLAALAGLAALPFLCVLLLRLAALREVLPAIRTFARRTAPAATTVTDEAMPLYSVLVPLFQEASVLPGLVRALDGLDYPRAKLEILLILEESDIETQHAILRLGLPAQFRTVVVPEAEPRTKPKALNYALQFARGDFVAVYDAEDRPEPDQLRLALEAFRRGPPDLGCVQAQLNIYNPRDSWLTRQLTVEYSALFDAILPALARLGLPLPLGGTSNHFRRETLVAVGGWDPFNVTEDADLGFRLARCGLRTQMLASTTWEEAPARLGSWLRQRTRWLKGWMQTYLVHTRRPWRLVADLGLKGALGFHLLMGGLVLSALVQPLFCALLVGQTISGGLLAPAATWAGGTLWAIAWINFGGGYLVSILVGAVSAWRRGQPGLALSALLMPFCWLLISAAAYRALYQLATAPYRWEKTAHGVPPRRSRR